MQLLMWMACVPTDGEKTPSSEDPVFVAPVDPSWKAEEVQSRLQAVLDGGLPDPNGALSGFAQMFTDGADPHDGSGGNSSCPNAGNFNMTESFSGCHSQKGYVFAGISIFTASTDNDGGFLLVADCYIIDAQGYTFSCGGEVEFDPDKTTGNFTGRVTGSWGYVPGKGWLSLDPSMALWIDGTPDTLSLNGGYGPEGASIYLENIEVTENCTTGAVWIQDPGGSWYTLTYGDSCDNCGKLTYAGTEYGTACIDLHGAAQGLRATMVSR